MTSGIQKHGSHSKPLASILVWLKDLPQVSLQVKSTIPVAKGMASSTADIAATIGATAKWLNKSISEAEIAKLCLQLEPTDSTIFESLTLFDHLRGDIIQSSIGCQSLASLC